VSLQNIFEYSSQAFDSKALFNSFKEAYEGNEDFIIEMFDVLSLFESFGSRRRMMHERMGLIIKKIEEEFKVNKMRVEILTALKKNKSYHGFPSLRDSREQTEMNLRKSESQGFIKENGLETVEKSIS
jgi:hypothetical protein